MRTRRCGLSSMEKSSTSSNFVPIWSDAGTASPPIPIPRCCCTSYEEYGIDCLPRLNGQFAFAIWDAQKRRLFLGRDRAGIRPLFYTNVNGSLLFASEVK